MAGLRMLRGAVRRARRARSWWIEGDPDDPYRIAQRNMTHLGRRAQVAVRVRQLRQRIGAGVPGVVRIRPQPGMVLYAHTDTFDIDVVTMNYVLGGEYFPAPVDGRVVLDLGAHKGYFAAWCLRKGAAVVYSLEPESLNLACMHLTHVEATLPGARWERRARAIGAEAGTARLQVSADSWSHSLYTPASGGTVRTEEVVVDAFGDLLDEVAEAHPDRPIVLKLNVEGAAGDCLLSVDADRLSRLEAMVVDIEHTTAQGTTSLVEHIESAGFVLAGRIDSNYWFRH